MIFCIYGPSCTGKTTVARCVAEELGIALRSCGDEVRKEAIARGVSISDLPDTNHREIDEATIVWASQHQPCVVEGRFLDAVFVGQNQTFKLIKLHASMPQRCARMQNRQTKFTFTMNYIAQADADDFSFRARMFDVHQALLPDLEVDTSELTVKECTQKIGTFIKAHIKLAD